VVQSAGAGKCSGVVQGAGQSACAGAGKDVTVVQGAGTWVLT
jgi:hypothetical protein